ncbi:unnamed protein product [Ostreobium quekettii]|uniref:Xaa-Pro dipeptidase n=1 Tax=Ostreobium quekettii TaxID=121088 RepID=A0A8S1IY27_9CHLO|nr:unnamed protein product [Ostreobium quekettii]|eukprot:evm.model.scf_1367.2 EVM.evm.TU.scf_1367.2   scf_1367:23148-34384(-)
MSGENGGTPPAQVYHMGLDTLRVDRRDLHRKIRAKVEAAVKKAVPEEERGLILLKGGEGKPYYDTDNEPLFRQESYFFHLFGVVESGWYGAMDLGEGTTILFIPRLPESHAVWMGALKEPEEYIAQLGVDEVYYVDELVEWLQWIAPKCLHVMEGTNSDSGNAYAPLTFDGIDNFVLEKTTLFPILCESRVIKLPEEQAIMRYANVIGSQAHVAMMHACQPGMMEYQLEATYLHHCEFHGGCRTEAYTCIAASGPNGAVLHYGHEGAPNDRLISDGDMVLADMGCKYYGYDSDITTTFPVNGKFTPDQRLVYESVLDASESVKAAMKPGVSWLDMHKLAERRILEGLKKGGLLTGDVDEMLDAFVGGVFMPHGLGHFLGLDTHDVGGYLGRPPRVDEPGRKSLRTCCVLEEGMVITVEPGCYFNPFLITGGLKNPAIKGFFVKDRIKHFEGFGGVRIEDNVIVTSDGIDCMTNVPRTVEDVEKVMAGGSWP